MRSSCIVVLCLLSSCTLKKETKEGESKFTEVAEIKIEGGELAAEISAYDPDTKRLFTSNNSIGNRVDVINISDPIHPYLEDKIQLAPLDSGRLTINSLAVKAGQLAVAASASDPQKRGSVFVFKSATGELLKEVEVGAMPDMVTFTPNGKFILSANEGEPNQTYTIDPKGSVSIITVENLKAEELYFDSFSSQYEALNEKGFRIFGPGADFGQDIEPEYVAVSEDSKYAWVTLQENNGIAKIKINEKQVEAIFPLGYKDFNLTGNEIDICDLDSIVTVNKWPLKGIYQPDAIGVFRHEGQDFIVTANEGDGRYYEAFSEYARVEDLKLDSAVYPSQKVIKNCDDVGRIFVTTTMGDTDNDGDYDELYTFGSRSFSIWNGNTGELIYDSGNSLLRHLTDSTNFYDDNRSDDKGSEPEGLVLGTVNNRLLAFIALERANSIVTYDITDPYAPVFLQILPTGIGPEGVLFVDQKASPNGRSLLIVSSEVDGRIRLYQPE